MKIGLLGGSFNPPHKGHIHISIEAQKHLKLDEVWWLPTKQNPLKGVVNGQLLMVNRIGACEKITKDYVGILVKDYESELESVYSIDLLREIMRKYPEDEFFFIIGADNIINFHLWHKWQDIIDLVPLIIVDRDDCFDEAMKSEAYLYCKKLNRCYFLKGNKCDISSTQIRNNEI